MTHARMNDLLQLPDSEFEVFQPHLELRSLTKGQILFDVDEVPAYVYFPVGAILSIFCELGANDSVQTTMVGKSSMLSLSNSGQPSFYRAVVETSGLAYRIKQSSFLAIRQQCPTFLVKSQDAIFSTLRKLHFAVACGKHHSVDQQILRWLLNKLDNSPSNIILGTHAEIAELLGFRREVVTMALGKLSMQGHIVLTRGRVEVPSRRELEARSCECYWLAKGLKRPSFTALVDYCLESLPLDLQQTRRQ